MNKIIATEQYIDSTPNGGYAIRILEHYRELSNRNYSVHCSGNACDTPFYKEINKLNQLRKLELDRAIGILKSYGVNEIPLCNPMGDI